MSNVGVCGYILHKKAQLHYPHVYLYQLHPNNGTCSKLTDKIAEFAHSVDLDEVAHNEPPHLDLHCLPSSL